MGTKRGFGRHAVRFFNVSAWIGLDSIRASARNVRNLTTQLFKQPVSTRKESYQEAVVRLGLNDHAQAKRKKAFLRMSALYGFLTLVMLGYAIGLTVFKHWLAAMMAYVLTFLLSSFAFREHFWYTQMRVKRLGMNFQDWVRVNVNWVRKGS